MRADTQRTASLGQGAPAGLSGSLKDLRPPPVDYKAPLRGGLMVLLGVVLLLVVAGLTIPIDGGVAADGQIAVEFQKKPVQHPSGGVLGRVLVREGELVSKDQVVAELISSETSSEYVMSELREFGLRATRQRLVAELGSDRTLAFGKDLVAQAENRADFRRILALEQQNFETRLQRYLSEREALEGAVQRLNREVDASRATLASRKRQLTLMEVDLARRRALQQSGFISEAAFAEFEAKMAEVDSLVQKDEADIARAERSLHETQSRLIQTRDDRRTAATEKLAEVNLELDLSTEKLVAANDKEGRLKLRSPADGRVVGIMVHAAGAVLSPGQILMHIVPKDEKRLIVARVPSHRIDGIVPGLPVRVRISTRSSQVLIAGTVETVSADKVDDERSGAAFYTVRVGVDSGELQQSGLVTVEVGMPVQVLLTLERRTFFAYLVRPLKKFFEKSLRE